MHQITIRPLISIPIHWTLIWTQASKKPDPGEPRSLENLEQTEILPGKVYRTEIFPEQTEILTKQTEIMEDQDA